MFIAPRPPDPGDFLPVLGDDTPEAIRLGRRVGPNGAFLNKIRYDGERHVLVFGANRVGKGAGLLVPNLLQMEGNRSVVALDIKGELAAVTAPYRPKLGRVVVLNPFGVHVSDPLYRDLRSNGFNPLAALDYKAPRFNSEASLLAEALVPMAANIDANSGHFEGSAQALVTALIMYVVIEARSTGAVPTMARVRELLCLASAAPSPANNNEGLGLPKLALGMIELGFAALTNKAGQFIDWNREIQGIANAAKRHTAFLDDTEIAEDLSKDGVDFRDLKRGPMTVYIVLPPEMLVRHAKWVRLVLSSALNAIMRPREVGEPRVLFMLDEFFAVGHLDIIASTYGLVAGYGIQFMPVLQDLGQLKELYPKMWETFIGMAGVVAYFAPNEMTSAEWISRRCGETTRALKTATLSLSDSEGTSIGNSPNGGGSNRGSAINKTFNNSPVKVPLITPHDLLGMQPGYMILTVAGLQHVIPAYAPRYFSEIAECMERETPNPYHRNAKPRRGL